MQRARITSFLVKVASRCNLDCDYCYVYHHADQSWRKMPKVLAEEDQSAFAARLAEYVKNEGLKHIAVIFHGGEPLLIGYNNLVNFARRIRDAAGPGVEIDIGLQTNGLILTDDALDAFEAEQIAVSLSMDGPREAHDRHRTTRKGRSSFDRVAAALERLKRRPAIFSGVIAVIDPEVRPKVLLDYFAMQEVPKIDFLLPDSHHDCPPPGRLNNPVLYEQWLIEAFDLWLDRYPQLQARTFEALLDAVSGLPSGTDAFGFGDVSLISLETDGSWHDLDVLKVAGNGATRLVGNVADTSIATVAASDAIAAHRRILAKEGLCATCQICEVVDICGGGSVPHRFANGGFNNPTVYCGEMKSLVLHARTRLKNLLGDATVAVDDLPPFDIDAFELAETSASILFALQQDALEENVDEFVEILGTMKAPNFPIEMELLESAARRAGTVAWQRAQRAINNGTVVTDVNGTPIPADPDYLKEVMAFAKAGKQLEVGQPDPWLMKPFGTAIIFEEPEIAENARRIVDEALSIIEVWRPAVACELRAICSAVQFIRDPSAHPDKIVSFSDNSVPGALFVSVTHGDGFIDAYDLADSLVHEYRHQKLYLFERQYPTTSPGALVTSPWREDLRPVSGLLHAVFVFVELRRFWEYVRTKGPSRLHNRAVVQLEDTERNLSDAFETLRSCELTKAGHKLADVLESRARQMPLVV